MALLSSSLSQIQFARRSGCIALLALLALPAAAQFRVEISGVGATQLPIAIVRFRDEDKTTQAISTIIRADLERSGAFRIVDSQAASFDESARPEMAQWRSRAADALVGGSVTRLADGRYDVRFKLWDVVKGSELGGQSSAVEAGDLRLAAHRIADFIYEKLTGEKGVFSTRIAYVTRSGSRHTLRVADADGENGQVALNSGQPIISPAWSPNGKELAYVSFERQKAVVFVHNVASGERRPIADFRGSNSAPAWAPDGERLAVTLSRDGGSQLFSIGRNGGEPRRLASSPAIDTEAEYSADGRWLLLHQRPRRLAADLPHGRGRRRARARHLQRQLQHQPDGQPRWPHARLHHARGQRLSPRRSRSRDPGCAAGHDLGHQRRRASELRAEWKAHHLCHTGARAHRVDDHHARWENQGSPAVPDGRSARAGVGPVRALAASRLAVFSKQRKTP
jgi:hypothetical protein